MLVLFDITGTGDGSFGQPDLLQVGVGSLGPADGGNAFDVVTKAYGTGTARRTYAFVADVLGRLIVFNVSYDKLFPKATPPLIQPPPSPTDPPPPDQILMPIKELPFPRDPYDGQFANCTDLAIDGNYLYCALGRAGVGVVDIANPTDPELCAVIDTPGLALGLVTRTVTVAGQPVTQLIVGDSRCGVRVLQQ
jgi:hypothetical protein